MKTLLIVSMASLTFWSCASAPPVIVEYRNGPAELQGAPGPVQDKKPVAAGGDVTKPGPGVDQKTVAPGPGQKPPTPVPVAHFDLPTDTADPSALDSTGALGPEGVATNNQKYTVVPMKGAFTGGAVTYNFTANSTYQVFVAIERVTNIILQPGEDIMGQPVTGDSRNFSLVTGASMVDGQRAVNLFLSPKVPGKSTNMVIITNRRTYNFELSSYQKTYMPIVEFQYPTDDIMEQAKAAEKEAEDLELHARITDCDFNYSIIPASISKPSWAPTIVFTDGTRTYMQFASAKRASYAPVFFALDGNNKPVILNYRIKGIFYIIDQVVEKGQLVLDKNDNNIITIQRNH